MIREFCAQTRANDGNYRKVQFRVVRNATDMVIRADGPARGAQVVTRSKRQKRKLHGRSFFQETRSAIHLTAEIELTINQPWLLSVSRESGPYCRIEVDAPFC
jgi:hypothetical protein